MCDKEKFQHLVDEAETKGQKVIDEANLLDSYVVTYMIAREAWKWTKRIWTYVKELIRRRGVRP